MIENGTPRTISSINKEGTSVTIKVEKQAGSGGGFPFQELNLPSFISYVLAADLFGHALTAKRLQDFLENYQFDTETTREVENELS